MTKRSTDPASMALSAKRRDTTPKPATRTKRGVNEGGDIATARARGIDTSTREGAEQIDPNKPLTEKQKLFVKFWAEGDSISSASVRAGYADGGTLAYRMVRMPHILKVYNAEKLAYEEASGHTRKSVMDMLQEGYDMAKLMAEPSSMIAAAREIGKMCGYYAPVETRLKVDVAGNVVHQHFSSMSDAELLKMIAEGTARAAPTPPALPAP